MTNVDGFNESNRKQINTLKKKVEKIKKILGK